MKTKLLSFHSHKFRDNIILITFPSLSTGFYSFFFEIIFHRVFHCERFASFSSFLLCLTMITTIWLLNICWSCAQLRYFCLLFPLFYFLFTLGKLFLLFAKWTGKRTHWTRFMIFFFSTEIFTLYSMKLLLELLFLYSQCWRFIDWVVLNFFFLKLSSLSVYKHCSIITLKRWWRFTRKLTNIYASYYIYEITN